MDRFAQFGDRDRVNYVAFLRFVARQAAAVSEAALHAGAGATGHEMLEHAAGRRVGGGGGGGLGRSAVIGAGHDGLGLGGADITLGAGDGGGVGWRGEAVDAAGGALPGDALADANVDHWLQTAATPADRRRFKELHSALRHFQHEQTADHDGGTPADDDINGATGLGQTM